MRYSAGLAALRADEARPPHEVLRDADVVDDLSDSEQRRDDHHPTEAALEERPPALVTEGLTGNRHIGHGYVQ